MGGFAVVAAPAGDGVTGVRTFIVGQDGVVQKNLAPAALDEFQKWSAATRINRGREHTSRSEPYHDYFKILKGQRPRSPLGECQPLLGRSAARRRTADSSRSDVSGCLF